MNKFLMFILSLSAFQVLRAQTTDTIAVIDGDTVNVVRFDPVLISASMDEEKIRQYNLLKERVKKVLPYAKMAAYKMQVMEDNLATKKTNREKRKYIKECEKSLREMYTRQLKDLSIEQGKVLMKLIHRETGKTTWEIMKNYRGSTEAIFWQAFGTVWGHDMKVEYDPVMDYQIEHIIRILNLE